MRKVRDDLQQKRQIVLKPRCLFVEKNPEAFSRLQRHVNEIQDIEIKLIHGNFEENIPEVLHFAKSGNNMFTFTFIDPTGWKGFGINNIGPLLKLQSSEILINFMTDFIIRFIDDNRQEIKDTFTDLFGTDKVQEKWKHLKGKEREDVIVETYRKRIKEESVYDYVADVVILNPYKDRTHYNLIYGTRKLDGLLAFRKVEWDAMQKQEKLRRFAQQNRRIETKGQLELFDAQEICNGNYFGELRTKYSLKAKLSMMKFLKTVKRAKYDYLLCFLEKPMTYEHDIKQWLNEWQKENLIEIKGLGPKERVPKKGKNHFIIWKG